MELTSLAISAAALVVSATTFWFTVLRRGTVKMTKPTQVGIGFGDNGKKNQVFVRALMFATSKRGAVLENMFARVRAGERSQTFSVWVYGEPKSMLRGAGLVVPETGIAANFHFLLRPDEPDFQLAPATYKIEVFGRLLGQTGEQLLSTSEIAVSSGLIGAAQDRVGLQFDWAPDTDAYVGHVAKRQMVIDPKDVAEFISTFGTEPGRQ
ncbi:hypothetical protein [uncultured Devosia sp.]|uniref:hypothetical protein n=1 Tax=uncultured Devosia sp. TaxID=211434 RepID=UPI002620A335|nr:hypothetical protein [uncultured Devosia sp.]